LDKLLDTGSLENKEWVVVPENSLVDCYVDIDVVPASNFQRVFSLLQLFNL